MNIWWRKHATQWRCFLCWYGMHTSPTLHGV